MKKVTTRVKVQKVNYYDIKTESKTRDYYVATRFENNRPTVYSLMTNKIGK